MRYLVEVVGGRFRASKGLSRPARYGSRRQSKHACRWWIPRSFSVRLPAPSWRKGTRSLP